MSDRERALEAAAAFDGSKAEFLFAQKKRGACVNVS
jgi:hypothetical protein